MNRRTFIYSISPALALPALLTSCSSARNPNVVLVLVDDLGWADLGCYGSTFYETPEIDRFAEQAVLFRHAYAASPVCSPTRAAIMTGQHPARLQITDWIPGQDPQDRLMVGPRDKHELGLEYVTLAEALKQHNYKTFFAGKWHLGDEGYFPEDQGFEINLGGHHRGSPPGGYFSPYKNPRLTDGPEGEYLPDRLTSEAIRFIEANQNAPFFLNISYYTVHTPIQASPRHIENYEQKAGLLNTEEPAFEEERAGRTKLRQDDPAYASMVTAMDENFGRLWRTIERLGLDEDTVVIFTSDNGGLSTLGPHREAPTSNGVLRAGKGWCYEGGIRVPLIISAPGRMKAGEVNDVPVISSDLYPTILDIAVGEQAGPQAIDGMSLVPVLEGSSTLGREALHWHFPHYHGSMWTPGAAIRSGDWKLIEFYEERRAELYHLGQDPSERTNLADQYPERTDSLRNELKQWQESVGAQMATWK